MIPMARMFSSDSSSFVKRLLAMPKRGFSVIDEGAKGRWWGSGNLKRGGGRLEMFKFGLYLSIPVTASFIYGYPEHMNVIVNKCRYIVYPAEGPAPMSGEEIIERIEAEREKRLAREAAAVAAAAAAAPPKTWGTLWR